ncbi:MAG: hypothetical protein NE330_22305, partial [Lentisphaeraceae bacterium]|nr:hypothetical protein [Lentisphaeraceae bacterium]
MHLTIISKWLYLAALFFLLIPSSITANEHKIKRIPPKVFKPIKTDLNVHFLNNKTLIIVGNYNKVIKKRILEECATYLKATKDKVWWSYEFSRDFASLEVINTYRPKITKRFSSKEHFQITNNNIIGNSYWLNAIGKMRLNDPYTKQLIELRQAVEVAHFAYLQLKDPLEDMKEYTISTKTGESLTFTYNEQELISRAIKVNQVGYHPESNRKYAYLGMWLGMSNGESLSLNFNAWEGKEFQLLDKQGKSSHKGIIKFRQEDQRDKKNFPVTGENVYELDFSNFNTPGKYKIYIEGLGTSWPFTINKSAIGDAFYTHAKGLYHK